MTDKIRLCVESFHPIDPGNYEGPIHCTAHPEGHACVTAMYERVPETTFTAEERATCGRVLIGQGSDTYDPLCVLPLGHKGPCSPRTRPATVDSSTNEPGAKRSSSSVGEAREAPEAEREDIEDFAGAMVWESDHPGQKLVPESRALAAEAERDRWREEAWQCYLASGADPDGADARHLNPGEAVTAVKESASDHDEALHEISAAEARVRELEEALFNLAKAAHDTGYSALERFALDAIHPSGRALSSPPGKEGTWTERT